MPQKGFFFCPIGSGEFSFDVEVDEVNNAWSIASISVLYFFYGCTVHFEIYVVHSRTNAVFINLVKSFKFKLKYTIISLLHVSVSNDHHQGALSVPN